MTGTKRGETVEPQVWGEGRSFPGRVFIDGKGPALGAWRTSASLLIFGLASYSGPLKSIDGTKRQYYLIEGQMEVKAAGDFTETCM